MGTRSTVKADPAIRAAVDELLKNGHTLDQIVAHVRELGSDVSRSAVGRYAQDYRELAEQQRDLQAVAGVFGKEFGGAEDLQGRMMIQLMTSVLTRAIMPIATGDVIDADGKELANLARAIKDVASASKTDVEREAKIRDEAAKRARDQAATAAETTARAAGASPETIQLVRAAILGLDA